MYFVSFMLNIRPCVERKLRAFLGDDLSRAGLLSGGEHRSLDATSVIPRGRPEFLESYAARWFLGEGWSGDDPLDDFPAYASEYGIDLDQTDELFLRCANAFSWVVFPWGTFGPFSVIAFLTASKEQRDRFAAIPNTATPADLCHIRPFNTHVASYDIESCFTDASRITGFGEFGEWGHRIWELQNCSDSLPLVVTSTTEWNWEAAQYHVLVPRLSGGLDFSVYRPCDKDSFLIMLGNLTSETECFVFPEGTEYEVIQRIVEVMAGEGHYSDLTLAAVILKEVTWCYVLHSGYEPSAALHFSREGGCARRMLEQAPLPSTREFVVDFCL